MHICGYVDIDDYVSVNVLDFCGHIYIFMYLFPYWIRLIKHLQDPFIQKVS